MRTSLMARAGYVAQCVFWGCLILGGVGMAVGLHLTGDESGISAGWLYVGCVLLGVMAGGLVGLVTGGLGVRQDPLPQLPLAWWIRDPAAERREPGEATELVSSRAPAGSGLEPEAASVPEGKGIEPEAAAEPEGPALERAKESGR